MPSVGIIEDDVEIREGLKRYLNHQPDYECVIDSERVEDFLPKIDAEHYPDILLLDIGLPGMSGIQGIKLIKEKSPEIEIMMLTVYDDHDNIFKALCAGASGYLLKNSPLIKIKEAIDSLCNGGAPMSPEIARKVIEYFNPHKNLHQKQSPLTEKEKEVVVGLVDGLSYKMIADRLRISIDTIRQHIRNIYRKLHVNCKAEVITKALHGEI